MMMDTSGSISLLNVLKNSRLLLQSAPGFAISGTETDAHNARAVSSQFFPSRGLLFLRIADKFGPTPKRRYSVRPNDTRLFFSKRKSSNLDAADACSSTRRTQRR